MKRFFLTGFALLLSALLPVQTHATWSLVKLDDVSKSIVVAGASCSYMVYGIAEVAPGKGVAIAQAASNGEARAWAVEQITGGKPLAAILAHITDPGVIADASEQQYALLSFAEWQAPLAWSGEDIPDWHGSKTAPGISVQANTMVSEKVVDAAFSILSKPAGTEDELIDQAFAALLAGSREGGDRRCGSSTAATAFISLHRAGDTPSTPVLELVVYGIVPGTVNAVIKLGELLEAWRNGAPKPKSTRQFVIPR